MMPRWTALWALCLLCLAAFAVPAGADDRPPVRIGVLAQRGKEVATRMWTPLAAYLGDAIPNRRFEIVPLDYSQLAPTVAQGGVDFILTAAGQYIDLEMRYGVTHIATVMNTGPNGDFAEYGGVLVTLADRQDIVTAMDLKGRRLLIPDRLSFGGWQMQWRELKTMGLTPDRDFSVIVAGDNEKTFLQLLEGKGDVAAARTDVFERMARDGKLDPSRFRLLSTPAAPAVYPYWVSTRLYPEWPLAKLRETPDDLARRVVVALFHMPRDSEAARAAEIVGWTVPKGYQVVDEMFRELRLPPYADVDVNWHTVLERYWEWLLAVAVLVAAVLLVATVRVSRARQRIVEEKEQSETYLNLIGTMIVVLDREARIIRVNRRTAEVLGQPESHLLGRNWFEVAIAPETREQMREVFATVMRGDVSQTAAQESEVITAAGGVRLVRWTNRLVRDDIGDPLSVISAGEDVTEQRRVEKQVRLFARVFEHSVEGVLICDAHCDIISVNPAFSEITGYSPTEVLGCNPRLLASKRHDVEFYRQMWAAITADGRWQGEIFNRRKDGGIFPEWLSISVMRDADGQICNYIGIFSDISRQKQDQERIHNLAFFDALTQLPNRALLADRFDQAVATMQRSGRRLGLIFIDLDRFKQINDSLGHLIGDELLKLVANRFRECLRESDTLARLGGDEFILLLPDLIEAEDAAAIARRCIDALRTPASIGGTELRVSPSLGIAIYPQDGETLDALIKSADTAMYAAKDAGRNTFQFFTGDMNARVLARMLLETQLRQGIEKNEFVLFYQPQLDIPSGRIIGAEALIRWQHPTQGLVFPGAFISAAEETGLIVPLGDWVLREACRQNAAWQAAGFGPIHVAVNVAAPQFRLPEFFSNVTRALQLAGLDARWLELELTESLLIEDVEATLALLKNLKSLGICLSVDDFGTGYSSLSYLKRFPVDKLKVDQSFVRDLTADADDHAIAASIIALGHHLGLRVVAEGVETVDQLEILRGENCDEYQGYYFSKPIPAAAFEKLLRDQNAT